MIDYRTVHADLLMKQQRMMNAARRDLADEISEAITARCGDRPTYDPACHYAVMRDVDRILDSFYGKRRGDTTARYYRIITDCTLAACNTAIALSRQQLSRHLTRFAPDVLRALKARARDGVQSDTQAGTER